MIETSHKAIALQLPQCTSQHSLGHPVKPATQISVPKAARHAQGVNNPKRPPIASMRQQFALEPIVIVTQRCTNGV